MKGRNTAIWRLQALCNNQKKSFSDPMWTLQSYDLPESPYKIHDSQESEYVPKKSKKDPLHEIVLLNSHEVFSNYLIVILWNPVSVHSWSSTVLKYSKCAPMKFQSNRYEIFKIYQVIRMCCWQIPNQSWNLQAMLK